MLVCLRGHRTPCEHRFEISDGSHWSDVKAASTIGQEVAAFLDAHEGWIFNQMQRAERLQKIRLAGRRQSEILFRTEPTRVRVEETPTRWRGNTSW